MLAIENGYNMIMIFFNLRDYLTLGRSKTTLKECKQNLRCVYLDLNFDE